MAGKGRYHTAGKESQTTTKRGCAGGKEMRAPIIEEAKRKRDRNGVMSHEWTARASSNSGGSRRSLILLNRSSHELQTGGHDEGEGVE
jgi:hypothetical protein